MLFNVLLRKLNMYEVLGRGANIAIKRFAFFFLLVFSYRLAPNYVRRKKIDKNKQEYIII